MKEMVDVGMGLPVRPAERDQNKSDDQPLSVSARLAIIFGSAIVSWVVVIGAAYLVANLV
jgi:hypothetical protein